VGYKRRSHNTSDPVIPTMRMTPIHKRRRLLAAQRLAVRYATAGAVSSSRAIISRIMYFCTFPVTVIG